MMGAGETRDVLQQCKADYLKGEVYFKDENGRLHIVDYVMTDDEDLVLTNGVNKDIPIKGEKPGELLWKLIRAKNDKRRFELMNNKADEYLLLEKDILENWPEYHSWFRTQRIKNHLA